MMQKRPGRCRSTLVALLLAGTLAACSHDTTAYPSLAPRPGEKLGFAEPATPPPRPVPADPAIDAKVADLTGRLATIARGFDAALARTGTAARAAGARTVGSDAWLDAQTLLGGLDDWRAQASSVVGDAADLASARAAVLAPDYPALATLQAAAAAEMQRQDRAITALQMRLPAGQNPAA